MVFRGARSASDISYDWMPYLHSHNGAIFKDERSGDFTVTINSAEGRKALDTYVELAKKVGPPNPGSYGQAQVIQALVTGKVKLTRHNSIARDERPEAFWGVIAFEAAIGIGALIYGALHFGPGG